MHPPQVSIVLPAYQVGAALATTVAATLTLWRATGRSFEVVIANDGSSDGAPQALDAEPELRVLHLAHRGKGAAVRSGLEAANGSIVVVLDADGDIDPRFSLDLVDAVDAGADVAVGTRPGNATQSAVRHVTSWAYRALTKVLFRLPVTDTQAGAKAYRQRIATLVAANCAEEGFSFDIEALSQAAAVNATFTEVPVEVVRTGTSTVGPSAAVQMAVATVALRFRMTRRPVLATAAVAAYSEDGVA